MPPVSSAEKLQRAKTSAKKESCPFCQEQKKRPLIAYMRKRAQEKHGKICEDEEAEEEAAANAAATAAAQQHCHEQHHHRQHQHTAVSVSAGTGKENTANAGRK